MMKEAGEIQFNEHIPDGKCSTGPKWKHNDTFSWKLCPKTK